ncbi:hypothetical protein [Magnetospirillum molischianum]|uniref:Uncharacterized protein n=1 Tax=Magnetospirillum molischianum DSM 120 TaxID=1150626 RepID=H8FP53_MAGML|nr:hypothetical protein [Magnetospirillum molischianum]CCG40141.1 hypothetical protein PHAMO_180110 [Magnetospirillum molischianum DSM 120]
MRSALNQSSSISRLLSGTSVLFQGEQCKGRARKTTVFTADDLQFAVAISQCLAGMARETVGGIRGLAKKIDVDPRTLQGWIAMEALPRLTEARRIAKSCPPFADLLAREMGLPLDTITASDVADLRRSVDTAARVVERLAGPNQLALI